MDVGDVISGWRIVEDAGAGRSGHVFIVCREGDPDRLFALKMQQTDRPDVAPDANAREAALLLAGMKKSPCVMPALVETGEWRGVPFFVMERIEGIDFPVPARRYRQFCVEAFTALAELHSWLVHCDIAPCHLGRKGGGIAFVDFDASLPHAEAARGGRCVGTDPYIAPEVAIAGRLSEQSDMYSLAMVLLEHCPKKQRDCFDPVLRECLRPAPADRPRSALDMATRLRTCKPPHHRFRAIVKWTALAFASAVFIYGVIMFWSYVTRWERSQKLSPGEISAGSQYRSGCILLESGDMTNAVRHLRAAAYLGNAKAKEKLRCLRLAP
ncbi:MAG: hypothetical protein IJG13_05720 [Kiritimatiellae bacterium]|nr:hypothetical protein [Kiritimatiellia bacterium]